MIRHAFIEAGGVRFHCAEQGTGPLVLLLHGFPECWYSWRHQLPALAAAGYRAVAPDLRGYNLSDKPRGGYNIESLAGDIVAIAGALGEDRAHVAGHDWGGVIAWQVAWRYPAFTRSLVAMNAPHPAAYAAYVRRHPRQMLRSVYMLLFQAPGVAEWLLTRRHASAVGQAFRRAARRPDAFTGADLAVYRDAFLRPGAARAALSYYRQALRQGARALPSTPIEPPTLVLWGIGDPALERGMNDGLEARVRDLRVRYIEDCGHWTQQERPDIVTPALVEWLASQGRDP